MLITSKGMIMLFLHALIIFKRTHQSPIDWILFTYKAKILTRKAIAQMSLI